MLRAVDMNLTPHEGQAYRSPTGAVALYVRTEKRTKDPEPQHLLIEVRDRAVFQRWLPAAQGVPPELELIHDPEASARTHALEDELREARAQRDALSETLKAAVAVVPPVTAGELRKTYREAFGRLYDGRVAA